MDDRLRSQVETEEAAQLECGRDQDQTSANKLVGVFAVLLVLVGAVVGAANVYLVQYIWGLNAMVAKEAPPREGIGQVEFVLAYLLGNGGLLIGTFAILIGLGALAHYLSGVLQDRYRAPR